MHCGIRQASVPAGNNTGRRDAPTYINSKINKKLLRAIPRSEVKLDDLLTLNNWCLNKDLRSALSTRQAHSVCLLFTQTHIPVLIMRIQYSMDFGMHAIIFLSYSHPGLMQQHTVYFAWVLRQGPVSFPVCCFILLHVTKQSIIYNAFYRALRIYVS